MNDPVAGTARAPRGVLARGIIAGVVGASVLALWFLVIDGLQGQWFRTPAFLGRVVLGREATALAGAEIVLYTVLHYGAFLGVGLLVAWLTERLNAVPGILLGAVLGFLFFDLLFYGSVWLTGVDVVDYLGWPEVLSGNVLAGIALVGAVTLLSPARNVSWGEILAEHRILREGLLVGALGAAVVAGWFLLIDVAAGRLLFTPAALGSVVFYGAAELAEVRVDAVTVLGYTLMHTGAFLATGLVAAGIIGYAEDKHPYVILGAILLFVTFETFFVGLVTLVAQWLLAVIPWWSIAVANLVAAAAMGWYLWRRHPGLAAVLADPDLERDVEAPEAGLRPAGWDLGGRPPAAPGTADPSPRP